MKPVAFTLAHADKPLILVDTTVNGEGPFRFVLDTGAGVTILTPSLADKLAIERGECDEALGAGGKLEIHHGTVNSFAVGDTLVEDLKVGIMDLAPLSTAIEVHLDGIVGYSFLSRYRVVIDYRESSVAFE